MHCDWCFVNSAEKSNMYHVTTLSMYAVALDLINNNKKKSGESLMSIELKNPQ